MKFNIIQMSSVSLLYFSISSDVKKPKKQSIQYGSEVIIYHFNTKLIIS